MRDWNKFGVVVFTDLTEKRKLSLEVENFHRKWINLWPKKIIIQKHEIPKEMVWIGRVDLKMGDNRLITDTLSYFDIARNNAGYVICNI